MPVSLGRCTRADVEQPVGLQGSCTVNVNDSLRQAENLGCYHKVIPYLIEVILELTQCTWLPKHKPTMFTRRSNTNTLHLIKEPVIIYQYLNWNATNKLTQDAFTIYEQFFMWCEVVNIIKEIITCKSRQSIALVWLTSYVLRFHLLVLSQLLLHGMP